MKKFVKKTLGEEKYLKFLNFYKNITGGFSVKSYSQEGEDLILLREFEYLNEGFYVDVGAYHPKRFSNTYLFYKKGWRGINIDARPGSMRSFEKHRSRDINLEFPVSDISSKMIFYTFNEPAISGFHEQLSLDRAKKDGYRIIKSEKMNSRKLGDILDQYLPNGINISFLTVDVEGHDLNVLKSNNWNKYSPEVVLIEELSSTMNQALVSESSSFLYSLGYDIFAKTPNTSFFRKARR